MLIALARVLDGVFHTSNLLRAHFSVVTLHRETPLPRLGRHAIRVSDVVHRIPMIFRRGVLVRAARIAMRQISD